MKTIKLLSFIISILFLTIGCQQQLKPIKESKDRYVKEFDTVYKVNSFDIDYVKRTFYKHEDFALNTYLEQVVGKDEISFYWIKKDKGQLVQTNEANFINFKNENEFLRFLNLVDTLENNSHKALKFDFDNLGLVKLETSPILKQVYLTHTSTVSGIGHGIYLIRKNEIDSIRSVYNKSESE
jgi:hypothetical protein